MRASRSIVADRLDPPKGWRALDTNRLMNEMGLVTSEIAGFATVMPIGAIILRKLETLLRAQCRTSGYDEVILPLIQRSEHLTRTGRAAVFEEEILRVAGHEDLLLAPTNEEVYAELLRSRLSSWRQLPLRVFQIAEKFRFVPKPKGALRSRQFLMLDAYVLCADAAMREDEDERFEELVRRTARQLALTVHRTAKPSGGYVDFLATCPEGETTIRPTHAGRWTVGTREDAGARQASSVAMYMHVPDADTVTVTYQTRAGLRHAAVAGSYGVGVMRTLHAVLHQSRDDLGVAFPPALRPFEAVVAPIHPGRSDEGDAAERVYHELAQTGSVLLDDRRASLARRLGASEFWGAPVRLVIGPRELGDDTVTAIDRTGASRTAIPRSGLLAWWKASRATEKAPGNSKC